jgi:hypothetical protein
MLKKDEGGRMKDENNQTNGVQLLGFILHPSAFILQTPVGD